MKTHRFRPDACVRQKGLSLLELMVALALGALLSIGIASLFSTTSNTNRAQEGIARLQENGRYAINRIEADLRQTSSQYCSNRNGPSVSGTVAPLWPMRAPRVFAASISLPDSNNMNSVATSGAQAAGLATSAYGLSPRFFMQGYACANGGTCSVPTSVAPAAGLAAGNRVPNTDVLTFRYQRGTGWPVAGVSPGGTCATGSTLSVLPQAGDDPLTATTFVRANKLVMVADCENASILPVAAVSGTDFTLGPVLPGTTPPGCAATGLRDRRVFNFSDDFVTVTYFLRFAADANPGARGNGGGATRLIPVLARKENGGTAQDLVQGVDLLEFRFAVQDNLGNTRYLNADQVGNRLGNSITCPPKAVGVNPTPGTPTAMEPGCLWRAVRTVETRLLVNSIDEVGDIDANARAYRFSDAGWQTPGDGDALPSGLLARNVLRREFVSQVSSRNYNP